MPPKNRVDVKKAEQERLQAIVIDLLREEDNKYCADCDAKQPRWASWNLGVFICIRCAGIHRNLGVHITKVKSVNLDSWTAEQVQSMRVMGNAKAKAIYEAQLPEHFRRPHTDQSVESFIRAKYEHKRYMLRDWAPPKVDVNDLPPPGEVTSHVHKAPPPKGTAPLSLASPTSRPQTSPEKRSPVAATAPAPVAAPTLISFGDEISTPSTTKGSGTAAPSLLDDLFGDPVSAPPPATSTSTVAHAPVDDWPSLAAPAAAPAVQQPVHHAPVAAKVSGGGGSGLEDIFGGMSVSAPAPAADSSANGNGLNFAAFDEKKSNVDILALFGAAQQKPLPPAYGKGGFASHPGAFAQAAALGQQHAVPAPVAQHRTSSDFDGWTAYKGPQQHLPTAAPQMQHQFAAFQQQHQQQQQQPLGGMAFNNLGGKQAPVGADPTLLGFKDYETACRFAAASPFSDVSQAPMQPAANFNLFGATPQPTQAAHPPAQRSALDDLWG